MDTPLGRPKPLHTHTRLVTRQDVSSVHHRRSTTSSSRRTLVVVHIDGDNTDTETTTVNGSPSSSGFFSTETYLSTLDFGFFHFYAY